MEHRGVDYRIIQGIERGLWKWSVETEPGTKSATSDSKDAAIAAAKRAIDTALDPKKQSLFRQRENKKPPPDRGFFRLVRPRCRTLYRWSADQERETTCTLLGLDAGRRFRAHNRRPKAS